MKSVDFIVTAKHYSEREGAGGSVKARILKWREKMHKQKGVVIQIVGLDAPNGEAVKAYIWQGQWIARCECGGNEFVDPSEPIFFCFSCGNRGNNQRVRPVEFPDNVEAIEAAVLARPVTDLRGISDLERAGLAQPLIFIEKKNEADQIEFLPLTRSWNPDETLADLQEQNQVIEKWYEELAKGDAIKKKPEVKNVI